MYCFSSENEKELIELIISKEGYKNGEERHDGPNKSKVFQTTKVARNAPKH